MRLPGLTCWCVLVVVVACDRSPPRPQPVSPSGPPPTAVVEEPIREAPAVEPEPEPKPEPEPEPEPVDEPEPEPAVEQPTAIEPSREPIETPESSELTGECCRTCRKGKACGDTCVARDRQCTLAPGCACDAQ